MAADFVVVLHAVFVLFASLGGVIVLKWPRAAWLHVPCFLWAAWIELAGWLCPLTPLENLLRAKAGAITYQTGFIAHYLMPVLYPEGLTRTIQVCLGLVVLIGNVILYAILINSNRSGWWRHSRRPSI
jgi:hypothetical protein